MVLTINSNGSERWRHGIVIAAAASLLACSGDDGGPVPDQNGTVGGHVRLTLGGDLVGADISIDQLDYFAGTPTIRVHEGDTTTDSAGYFELLTGVDSGYFLVTARGGQFVDYATGQTVALDPADELKTILYTDPLEDLTTGLVSPVGHLTQALALSRLEAGMHPSIVEAHAFATEHVDRHFGDLPWERLQPADLAARQTSPTAEVRAALILGAWSLLAADTAAQAGSSVQEINPYTLAVDLGEDLATGPFDGNDGNNKAAGSGIQLGTCPPVVPGCVEDGDCTLGQCRSLCDAYAGSLRATLSAEVTKLINDNDPGGRNQTGLSIADTLAFARTMNLNGDEVLFGAACVESLDRLAPTFLWDAMPAQDAIVRGTISVRVRIIDDTDAEPVVTWAGDLVDTDGAPDVAQAMINTASAADGALMVTADAIDASGNGISDTRNLIADNTPPTLTVSSNGFVVDGQGRWWTTATAPVISGTITEVHGPSTVQAFIGGQVRGSGTFASGAWSITLEDGVIASGGSAVSIRATDAVGNVTAETAATSPLIVVDSAEPVLQLLASTMYNETLDTITFSASPNDRPSHLHAGMPMASIGSPGSCPMVYRHAYLTDTLPAGEEPVPRNELAFSIRAGDEGGIGLDPAAFTYTVRAPSGATAGPFPVTGVPVAGSPGSFDVTAVLHRDGVQAIPAIGVPGAMEEGVFTITFDARDLLNQPAFIVGCWHHNPLGPPVKVVQPARVVQPAGVIVSTMATYALPMGPTSQLLNGTATGGILELWVRNPTPDPAYLTFASPTPTGATFTKRVTAYLDATTQGTVSSPTCALEDGWGDPLPGQNALCYGYVPAPNPDQVVSSPTDITGWEPSFAVYDLGSADVISGVSATCAGCAPNEWEVPAGQRRAVVVGARKIESLRPSVPGPYAERDGDYTGAIDPGAPEITSCIMWTELGMSDNSSKRCSRIQRYEQHRALWQAGIVLGGGLSVTWQTAARSTLSAANPNPSNDLPTRRLTTFTWSTTEN